MKVRIDRKHDIVRILFRNATIEESDEVQAGVIYDYDVHGKVVSIEFLNASRTLGPLEQLAEGLKASGVHPHGS